MVIELTKVNIKEYHYYQIHTTFYPIFVSQDDQCGFQCNRLTIDQIFCNHQILVKNGSIVGQYISHS
jgi:hypothetical protein